MTSKTSRPAPSDCYVYITLPGQVSAVTAGRYQLTADRLGRPFGRFVYGKSYLNRPDRVEIDPVELRLATQTYETTALKGVFGSLRDAGPDYWGRRVIEKHAGKPALSELDYLLESPDDRAGALGFGLNQEPPAPRRNFNQTLDLERLQAIAEAILRDDEQQDTPEVRQIEEIMLLGTSMGGARPKAVVEDGEGLWLAKFNRPDDKWNYARVEHAMLTLAQRCGMTVAESCLTTIGNKDVLLVKRFDREKTPEGYLRARMVSGLTLLHTEDTHQSREQWSYVVLAEELRRICEHPQKQAQELFRRMCFNALISNTDDHPRNHAAIARQKQWKLSPAYDLTPAPHISLERRDLAMICGDWGRYANAQNILTQAPRFSLQTDEAKQIVDEMERIVQSQWYDVARQCGVSEQDCKTIKPAFEYPGFRQPLPPNTQA